VLTRYYSFVTQPNMYARGILFGKMKYELGDHAIVRCPETGLEADVEFKVKGWMGGTYNAIGGYIKESSSGKNLYELSGLWHEKMYIKDLSTGKKELFFDASVSTPSYPKSRPLNEQGAKESQRLWDPTTKAIKKADQKVATEEKSRVEDEQRREAAERGGEENWQPRLFKAVPPGDEEMLDWILAAPVDDRAPAQKQVEQILAIAPILPGQQAGQESNQATQLSSEKGQSLPLQQGQQSQQAANARSGDLIDFGQNDGSKSAVPSQPTTAAAGSGSRDSTSQMGNMSMQQQQQGSYEQPIKGRGNPLRRAGSTGEDDTFVDAES